MKKFKFILCAALLTLVSVASFAQEVEENRDTNGNIVRGPYQTNSFWDNWFVGAGGGANTLFANGNQNKFTPVVQAELGKWFTPTIGLRLGYQGWNFKEIYPANNYSHYPLYVDENGAISQNYYYIHGDAMYNITNAIWGYKEKRFWNVSPYLHAGFLHMNNPGDGKICHDNEFSAGPGLLNTFRLTKRIDLTLDIRDLIFSERFHDYNEGGPVNMVSAMVGIRINLGKKTYWRRFNTELVAANAALTKAYDEIEALKNAPKEKEIVEVIKEVPAQGDVEMVPLALGVAPITLYFPINETELNVTERAHLDYYVHNILEKDPNRVFYLTGTADEGTGTQSINERLSLGRVKEVIRILKDEYGITSDRLVLKAAEIVNVNKDPRLDRSVIIEH